jgi:5'-3' exonuclease
MGIKQLNRYLVEQCKKTSICKKKMEILRDKTIVIDTSIYMYKYHAQNALIENFYLLLSMFHKYHITPIFIFDGKPPAEKYELLKQRKADKYEAENRFAELQLQLETEEDVTIRTNLTSEMKSLKRQFIRISQSDNKAVKRLIESYGAVYYEANGEADRVCAYMVTSGKAWACLSDDMDMFVYGCNRVLRHLSVINETILLYNMDNILTDLKMSMTDFRQIAVVSGTDYNINEKTNLIETLKWFREYIHEMNKQTSNETDTTSFYSWLIRKTKYVRNYESLSAAYDMFVLDGCSYPELDELNITLTQNYDVNKLHEIMKEDGFIFT